MKIAILANCQGQSIADCTTSMNPGIQTDFINATEIVNGNRKPEDIVAQYDAVFSQRFFQHYLNRDDYKITYFPNLVFNGYHPDMTYARGKAKGKESIEAIGGPMTVYHSCIAIYAYLKGKSVDEAIGMFNPLQFARLGYYAAWENATAELLDEGNQVGMPLGAMLTRWTAAGSFMYSFNHPKLFALADITRAIFKKINLPAVNWNPEDSLQDPMKGMPIWPIYPSLAERHGLDSDYAFKLPYGMMLLPRLVEETYQELDKYERDTIEPLNFSVSDFDDMLLGSNKPTMPEGSKNPYSGLPKVQFWRNSVASVEIADLDPVVDPRFVIKPEEKLATAGSCFAQHIARTLSKSGFNYYVPEAAPEGMSEEEAHIQNFGTYSARFGNIYTVRQLLQLIQRSEGRFTPQDSIWTRPDGKLIDPFRPQITPEGFDDEASLLASREVHLGAVREMLREMEYFVFTLGLTEGWRARADGAVFPLAPGVAGGDMDFDRYEFINFSIDEIRADLFAVIDLLQTINPKCKIILTVSPVPLIATFEPRHALVATTYSKALLRAAADMAAQIYGHVDYFASYEIITGSYTRGAYFADDLREVKPEGVAHVMGVFMRRYTDNGGQTMETKTARRIKEKARSNAFDIVCDEEAIARF